MRIVSALTGEDVPTGTVFRDGRILLGILAEPREKGYTGYPFVGRLLVRDVDGNEFQPLPFEYGLDIVP